MSLESKNLLPLLAVAFCATMFAYGSDGARSDDGNEDGRFVGTWKAVSADMGDKVPPEVTRRFLKENPLSFELKSVGSARIIEGDKTLRGVWTADGSVVEIDCPGKFLKLHYDGRTLTTLPDKTFVFERQSPP